MTTPYILDTGPLLAWLNQRDPFHQWAVDQLATINQPLATCEAVLAEACHLTRIYANGRESVLELLNRKVIKLSFDLQREHEGVGRLLRRYSNVPMSLADACLVRMSELESDCAVVTLDSDFRIFRRHGRKNIPLILPPSQLRALAVRCKATYGVCIASE